MKTVLANINKIKNHFSIHGLTCVNIYSEDENTLSIEIVFVQINLHVKRRYSASELKRVVEECLLINHFIGEAENELEDFNNRIVGKPK